MILSSQFLSSFIILCVLILSNQFPHLYCNNNKILMLFNNIFFVSEDILQQNHISATQSLFFTCKEIIHNSLPYRMIDMTYLFSNIFFYSEDILHQNHISVTSILFCKVISRIHTIYKDRYDIAVDMFFFVSNRIFLFLNTLFSIWKVTFVLPLLYLLEGQLFYNKK